MVENGNKNKLITQWGYTYLTTHGYTLKGDNPEVVQTTPWSYVIRYPTTAGYIYLKHTPHLLAIEAKILQILKNQFYAPVAEVIAHNIELDCFLMKDAGRSLRETLKKNFDTKLLTKAINEFTSMQLAIADHVNILIENGVPDWRLNKLPELYAELLTHKDLLVEDGLSENEIRELEKLIPKVIILCDELSHYSIKESIVQPDFNDNNTLLDDSQKITIIDLGEIVISHPFFSLLNVLQQINKHHGLKNSDKDYLIIKDACLNNFMSFESRENLIKAFELCRPLWFVYGALAGHRLIDACSKEKILSFQHGKFVVNLRDFIGSI